jgi:hypothetical protein
MNFALFDRPGVFTPLHDLMNWLAPMPQAGRTEHKSKRPGTSAIGFKLHHPVNPIYLPTPQINPKMLEPAQKPLRIVRILEAGHAPANVGRMVISGRMSDVCAELDRLAAKEASLH